MPNLLIKDLRVIADGFSDDVKKWPDIPCPTCGRGNLSPVVDTFVDEEAETSKQMQADYGDHWEADWFSGAFYCVLRCGKSSCDLVRVLGSKRVVDNIAGWDDYQEQWRVILTPTFFHPSLPLVQSHESAPKSVLQRIEAGAAVIWVDPSSAANRLRSAVEALLEDQGIPKRGTLHQRIEDFKKAKPNYSDAADALLAAKWIGNVGSHEDGLEVSNVLDSAEVIDFALAEIYDTSRDAVKKMAADITARKGMPA
ncbi:DUF4145 domain-containing protein [Streptomyces sp. NPDC002209]|uniref:DUF4145 domain-containing protein n=1 Tax=Streptomyces sp. NPDC002209 TaxID=3364638 RepID=UPI0036CAA9FA